MVYFIFFLIWSFRVCVWIPFILLKIENWKQQKNNKKVTVYAESTVHLPIRVVHVPWTVQEALVLKKKREKENLKCWNIFSYPNAHLVQETLFHASSLRSFSFSHTFRQENVITHVLTQRARLSFPLLIWMEYVPPDINMFFLADLIVH